MPNVQETTRLSEVTQSLADRPGDNTAEAIERLKTEQRMHNGANWLLWIAGLSVVNSIITMMEFGIVFPVGLGVTQVIDAFALVGGGSSQIIGLGMTVAVAAIFIALGFWARKGNDIAYVTGIGLYAVDGLIFLLIGDWLSIAFHAWGCFGIYGGLKANKQLQAIRNPNPLQS